MSVVARQDHEPALGAALPPGLTPAAKEALSDVSSVAAVALVDRFSVDRINLALTHGAGGPLRGRHLVSLANSWSTRSIEDYLDWAEDKEKRLERVASLAERLVEAAKGGFAPAKPVGPRSIAVDSTTAIGIDHLLSGEKMFAGLGEHERAVIAAIRDEERLGPYVDPAGTARPVMADIIGPTANLLSGSTSTAELVSHPTLLAALRGIPSAEHHPDYQAVLRDLETADVGKRKGAPDRAIIADALLAPRPGGGPAIFATSDSDVLVKLARHFGLPQRFGPSHSGGTQYQQLRRHRVFGSGRFRVEIRGHRMIVIYGV